MQIPGISPTIPATEAPTDLSRARLAIVVGNQIMSVPAVGLGDAFGFQPLDSDLTSWAAITRATGFDTFVATPNSANLRSLLTDETGTGAAVFANAPTITGVPVFSGVPSLTGGGLAFPATQVPSANANTIDDYEEGTFTPELEGATTAGVGTYNTNSGIYTKIGNIVYFRLSLDWSAHTGTGSMRIIGLPFTPNASLVSPVSAFSSNITFSGQLIAYVENGQSRIQVRSISSGAAHVGIGMDTAGTFFIAGVYGV